MEEYDLVKVAAASETDNEPDLESEDDDSALLRGTQLLGETPNTTGAVHIERWTE